MRVMAETAPSAGSPGLTVAAVARRLGVAPATLRTWDRRYGVGPSAHSFDGSTRSWNHRDLAAWQARLAAAQASVAAQTSSVQS